MRLHGHSQCPLTIHPNCAAQSLSHAQLFVTPWTAARQAPLSMGLSRQEYWSGLLCPTPVDLPNPGIKPSSPASPALEAGFLSTEPPGKPIHANKGGLRWFALIGPPVITGCFDSGEHKLGDTKRQISHFIIGFQSLDIYGIKWPCV